MEKILRKFDLKTWILLVATLAWMALIFYFSSQPAVNSAHLSGSIAARLLEFFNRLCGGCIPAWVGEGLLEDDHFIRKAGHVFEYAVLGMLAASLMKRLFFLRFFWYAMLLCFFYAVSDEVHQAFVPGRGPHVADVLLDTAASLAGIALVLGLWRREAKRRN